MSTTATVASATTSATARPPAPLLESNEILDDAAALRDRLRVDGYLFFRRLVDPQVSQGVRLDVAERLHRLGWFATPDETTAADAFRQHAPTFGDSDYWPGFIEILKTPSVHEMARDPALVALVERLFGEPAVRQPRFVPRAVFPWPANQWSEMAAHQDMPYMQGSLDTLTAWMPMGACLNRGGGLEILRGSHTSGLRELIGGSSGRYRCAATEIDPDDDNWRGADYGPGDVLLFTCLTVHRAPRNHSELVRLTMDVRYQPRDSAMCEQLFETPYYPDVPGWEELVDADELARIEATDPAERVPFTAVEDFQSADSGRVFPWLQS